MTRIDPATVPGWGVDADPENDPAYPMRHTDEMETRGLNWRRPQTQDTGVEVLMSIEHDRRPAVVGTSTPPAGLSGMIRRAAFKRSESDWFHWLMLMGADRLNVVEGVVADLGHLKVPNIPSEMGALAEWRHNKRGFAIKTGMTLGLAALLVASVRGRSKGEADEPEPNGAAEG